MTSSTIAPPGERIARLRESARRIRHHALDMGEVQGQGYIGQALGVADILAVVYKDQLRFAPRSRTGRTATASCSRSATTRSRCTPRSPRPASSTSPSSRPTAPTARDSRCPGWRPTRPAWRSPAARSDTASASRPDGDRPSPPGQPRARLQPALRRRARRRIDLGGRPGLRAPPPRQRHRHRRRQRPAGRRPDGRRAQDEPSSTSGGRSAGTPCASTATTRGALDASTRSASTAAPPSC